MGPGRRDRRVLDRKVALHDVLDVVGFVGVAIRNSRINFDSPDEREELKLEGIAIMYELAGKFEPHREGYAQPGRFSGYAAVYLPKRLGEAWHKMHSEHRYVTRPDGKREWVFFQRALSFDQVLDGASFTVAEGQGGHRDDYDPEERILPREQWVPAQVPT